MNRKRNFSRFQVCDIQQSSPSESSECYKVLTSSSSQAHHSPLDLTDGKDTLCDGKSMVDAFEDTTLEDGLEGTMTVVTKANKTEYISTSSSVSQARASQQRKSFKKKDSQTQIPLEPPQTSALQSVDDESKDTSVSSSHKRKRSCSGAGDLRWSVTFEEEEERKKKRRRTEDVEGASSILSHYKIGKKLGEGGFGVVYKGRRLADGRQVAIKIAEKEMNRECIRIPGWPLPLPLEIALLILANKNPRIPEVIELLEWEDLPDQYVLVMERPSPCEDLAEFVKEQGGVLSEEVARVFMGQATHAAYLCSQRKVFHRDIKPENFLINPETLDLKLIDFGCGARMKKSAYNEFCGTRDFFPLEFYKVGQYHAKPATVWSLGITLFKMVCGHLPDTSDLQDISWGKWFQCGLSKECSHLIRSLLQEDPNCRMELEKILLHPWFG